MDQQLDDQQIVPISKLLAAHKRIQKIIRKTQLHISKNLSTLYNAKVYFKREDGQLTRSYKLRGCANKLINLTQEQKNKGIVCSSTGNQACGMAYVCCENKVNCTIFVPSPVPLFKINSIREFGKQYVTIIQQGFKLSESLALAQEYAVENNQTFLSFFDADIVCGVGTIGFEITDDIKENQIDYIIFNSTTASVVQGLGSFFRQMMPETKIIGVEPDREGYESSNSNQIGNFQNLFDESSTLIKPRNIINGIKEEEKKDVFLDRKIVISDGLACKFVTQLYDSEGIVIEPDSAIVPAALEILKDEIQGKVIVCLLSGHKTDLSRLTEIRTISSVYDKKIFYMMINFFRKPGALKEFLTEIISEHDDVLRVEYTRKNNREKGPALVGIQTNDPQGIQRISKKLEERGIDYKSLNPQDDLFKLKV